MVGFDIDPELSLALHTGHNSQRTPGTYLTQSSASESTSSSEIQGTNTRKEVYTGKADEKRTITLFYDGRMCTSTVTEIQARAIISLAKREMEKGKEKKPATVHPQKFFIDTRSNVGFFSNQPESLSNSSQMLNQGLSMKHSLQRFLQKRKTRIASTSPYSRPNCCPLQ